MSNESNDTFSLLEIPANKKRNPPTSSQAADTTSPTTPTTSNANNSTAAIAAKVQESETQIPLASGERAPTSAPNLPHAPKSRLSGFSLPLFSSTPLNSVPFLQKRRSSSKKARNTLTSPTGLTPILDVAAAAAAAADASSKSSMAENQASGKDTHDDASANGEKRQEELKSPIDLKLEFGASPKNAARTPISAETTGDLENLHRTQRNLLRLLDDFNSGKMKAFQNDAAMSTMKLVREKQERLAKLHFELYSSLDRLGVATETARSTASDNLSKLITGLQDINETVQILNSDTRPTSPCETST